VANVNFKVKNGIEVGTGVTISSTSSTFSQLNVGVGGTIITTTGIGSVGIGSTQPGSTLVVNAPSGYTGNLLDVQVGGSSNFRVTNADNAYGGAGTNQNAIYHPLINVRNFYGSAFIYNGSVANNGLKIGANSDTYLDIEGGAKGLAINMNSASVNLNVDGNSTLAQRNAGVGQTFRIYNTYTSSTNFERGQVGWNNNVFIVGTEKGSSIGTARQLELQTDGITRVAITTDGRVAIGTTGFAESQDLDGTLLVKRDTGIARIRVRNNSGANGTYSSLNLKTPNSDWSLYVEGDANVFRIFDVAQGVARVHISSAGNFGINNSSPTRTLDVTGNAAISSNLNVTGICTASTVNDSKGDVRSIPQNSQTSAYILAASDAGKHISITTGGVTVNSGIFSIGDAITIYNNSGSNQTITQGASVTLRQSGTANTGNRTLAQFGLATILCVASNTFVISGSGLS